VIERDARPDASQQGEQMDRNLILAAGALLWTVAALDAVTHLMAGDLVAPALMATAGIVGGASIAMRARRRRLVQGV
jgi:hypothetical protein